MSLIQAEEISTEPEQQAEQCAMKPLLQLVTAPWTLHILFLLTTHGSMRFGLLRRRVEGISARVLTVRLRMLEERGLVVRSVSDSKAPEVTYTATSRLYDMKAFMQQLRDLALKWQSEDYLKHQG